jgi:hypothetical protein
VLISWYLGISKALLSMEMVPSMILSQTAISRRFFSSTLKRRL